MGHSSGLARRFRSLLWKPGLDDEIADELAFHLEMRAREYAARGLGPAAAAAAARRRLGDLAEVKAACRAIGRGRDRAQRRARWLAETVQDLRLAGRRFGEQPGSTLLAVLALAIGLAGAATAWRVALAVLHPLPAFADAGSLLRLRQVSPQGVELAASAADYADWRRLNRSFAGMAAFEALEGNLESAEPPEVGWGPAGSGASSGTGPWPDAAAQSVPAALALGIAPRGPERILVARATASLLPLLGVRPLLGSGFTVGAAMRGGDHRVAVLSHGLWWRRFGADPGIVGRTLRLNGEPFRVLGVMPAGFEVPAGVGLWLPLVAHDPLHGATRDHHRLEVVGRLRPEVAARQAAADLAAVAGEVGRRHPESDLGWGVRLQPLAAAWAGVRWTRRARLLLVAAGLLWLLASASAANLLWSRATARQREIDLRAALGGGRGRIVRQLFAEGLLLAALGAVAGLLLAGASTPALRHAAASLPQLASLGGAPAPAADMPPAAVTIASLPRLDGASAGLVLVLALLSSLLCGIGPALQATRPGPDAAVRQSARLTSWRERRTRDALVAAELAVATTLLIVAGLLAESYLRLDRSDPGFDPDHLLSMRVALNGVGYPAAARRALVRRLEERLAALPGVEAAGFVSTAPLAVERPNDPFTLERRPAAGAAGGSGGAAAGDDGRRHEFLAADWRVATPGLFRALGLRLVAGRLLAAQDHDGKHPVVVIDSTLAQRCWPGLDPIGRRLRWEARNRELTVVGMVESVRDLDLEAPPRAMVFLPYESVPWRAMALVVRPRSRSAFAGLPPAIRREVAALAPGLPLSAVRSLAVARRQAVAGPRLALWLVALFAAAALALAITGVYATAASAVARRTPEIALRQALGASGGEVLRLVLGRSAALTLLGLGLGAAGALLFSRLLAGLLYDTAGTDLAAYGAAALLLGVVSMLASVLPARRAARIAPVLALRRE